jgi:hypothetical protein
MKRFAMVLVGVAILGLANRAFAGNITVYSNSSSGDNFTNTGTSNTNLTTTGAALGASGWYYNNVRNNGHVGITKTSYSDADGCVWFSSTQGPSVDSSKADIEYYGSSSLGKLSDVSSASYEWYRQSGSYTANANYQPAFRFWVSNGVKSGYLIYEATYQTSTTYTAPTDTWTTENITTNSKFWGTLGLTGKSDYEYKSLSSWLSDFGNYDVYGLSMGVGSGWGTFEGAIDDVSLTIGGVNTTNNFSVVPEPSTLAMLAGALIGLFVYLKRRK